MQLRDEPAPRALEASVAIDRRAADGRGPDDTFAELTPAGLVAGAAATAAPVMDDGPRGDLPALDRSSWDLASSRPRTDPLPAREPATTSSAPRRFPGDSDVEVDALEIHLRRPEPWRRVAAGVIDVAPFAAAGITLARWLVRTVSVGLPAPATGLDGFLDLLARERVIVLSVAAAVALALGVYATLAHALAGATLGKRLLGLRVVGPDGGRPTLLRSAVRSALVGLSAALLGLGVLLALFTRSGRALHDLLARTWVVEAP